jgi:hypothetical protein
MTIFFMMELCFKITCFIYKSYIPRLKGQITTTDTGCSCVVYPADASDRRFICYTEHRFITTVSQILAQTTKICTFIVQ